jgi:DNA-binding transcriptional LysR family regulator
VVTEFDEAASELPAMDATRSPLPSRGLSALTDLNDLEVFARVVEKSGFSRAAQELGVPASTVSRRVSRLEESLGVRLLQRTTRKMHLTEAGRTFFEQISLALRQIQSAEESLKQVQGTPRGLIRITTVEEPFIENVLFEFLREFPDVSLEIDKSHRRVDLVAEGFDVGIRAGLLADSSLVAHRLLSSGPILVAASAYLQRRGSPTSLSDLRNHDCVILGTTTTAATWQLGSAEAPIRLSVSGRVAVNSFGSAVEACVQGLGVGLFPEGFITPWLESGQLTQVLPDVVTQRSGLWIVHPSRNLISPAVRGLIDFVKESFKRSSPGPDMLPVTNRRLA